MSFECHHERERKPLLYADLFKRGNVMNMVVQKEEENMIISKPPLGLSSSSSSSSNQLSYSDSSSSGFSTPLYSDSSDDGDFVAELSRQMAECMLQEEEEEQVIENTIANYMSENSDVYELKNQAPITKEGSVYRSSRVKGTESAQQKQQVQKTEQQQFMQYRGKGWGVGHGHGRNGQFGSGMQAVFLGGSGSVIGSSGTGVFLPRDSTELKKKSGCSMVLMPTRVLQAMELHYNRFKDSTTPPPLLTGRPFNYSGGGAVKGESTISNGPRNGHSHNDDMQLPQEWTY
ncbi:hypothetical protein ACP275_14G078900 [Erythranthe tilingii]